MKKFLIFVLLGICCVGSVVARKEFRDIRTFIKNNNMGEALKVIDKCKKDSVLRNEPELYLLAAEVQKKLNDDQNKRLYLKQPYDTVSFFNTIYGMFDELLTCDRIESIPDSKGRIKPKNRGKIKSTLKMYYPNLYNAGLFFIKKKNYAEADKYFSMFINAAASPVFIADSLQSRDPRMPRSAFWSMTSCYELKKYQEVFKFEKLAMRDTANIVLCVQYKSMAYLALNDKPNMVRELKYGVRYLSKDLFFFSHLADYYNSVKDYNSGLALADSLLKVDSTNTMYLYAKSVVLFHQKKYEECLPLFNDVMKRDTANVDVYYYVASCYYNQATQIDDNIDPNMSSREYNKVKSRAKNLFDQARPYMEKFRISRPNDSDRWAAPLYRIYLSLNMAPQFQEMDGFLLKAEQEKKAKQEAQKQQKPAK